jgi:beta-N-acetylhexosaminidase
MTTHIRYQGFSGEGPPTTGPITFDGQALQQLLALPEFAAWRAGGGLVVSDSLGSQAVHLFYDETGAEFPHRRVARDALLAGQDLLLVDDFALETNDFNAQMANVRDTINWFEERYNADPTFQVRVDDAVLRILQQKLELYAGNFQVEQVLVPVDDLAERLNRPEDAAIVFRIAKNAISLLISSQVELPRALGPDDRVVVFTDLREARQCNNCAPQPYISPSLLEETILAFYGPEGSDQIQLNRIRSFTYGDLKDFLTTLPEPTPSPVTPTPTSTETPEATPGESTPQVTPTPPPTPTPSVVESVDQALAAADWIIFAALDVSAEAPASNALNLFLAQRPDIVRDSNIVVLNFNTPYHLDTTELSKLSASFAVYSKIEAAVEAAVQALFQESPVIGAPPVSLPSINYHLDTITQPDPDQIIDLYVEQDGNLQAPAREQPLEVVVGDTLHLVTGEIVDHNGNPVPDGTPVQFLQTDRLEGFTSFISQQPTEGGVARLDYVLEAQTGLFRITAVAGAATNSQQVDIIIGENVRIVVVTLTPAPTPTETPTVAPTATLTPSPVPTATATATPTPLPPEPGLSISLTSLSHLLGFFVGLALTGVASIVIGHRSRLSGPSAFLRLLLWGLLGGLVLYNYYMLQLPGSNWLAALGNWAGLVVTAAGGVIVLLVAAQAMQRISSPNAG